MLIGDLIYNDDFECNCNYAIYDCTDGTQCGNASRNILWIVKQNRKLQLSVTLTIMSGQMKTALSGIWITEKYQNKEEAFMDYIKDIKWDTDGDQEVFDSLPQEIALPEKFSIENYMDDDGNYGEVEREARLEDISDWLSDEYGFCHGGFCIVPEVIV